MNGFPHSARVARSPQDTGRRANQLAREAFAQRPHLARYGAPRRTERAVSRPPWQMQPRGTPPWQGWRGPGAYRSRRG